ncbi:MarR family winged helix-turn-helix transcriptional regulator [Nocardioides ferulae]|uniref:MarR family winged helix-turn-helix transcriptional regulator n=1 Tax=Nocardioides ferulae TaxID=2340821 RepID=UPI000EB477F3|nr:MarR family transcriptional regulator [Nocardioides ferulae]
MAPERYPQLELDSQLCFPLYAASRAVTRRYADLLGEVGLTYPQYLALLGLWSASAPLTVGELGARLSLDSGTLTPVLKRLEGAGWVSRRRDPEDERRVLVEPTAEGWALRERVADVPQRLVEGMGLDVAELVQLRQLLDRLRTALG